MITLWLKWVEIFRVLLMESFHWKRLKLRKIKKGKLWKLYIEKKLKMKVHIGKYKIRLEDKCRSLKGRM